MIPGPPEPARGRVRPRAAVWAVLALVAAFPAPAADPLAARWAAAFARPAAIPHPADNPPSAAKIALGRRLFTALALSADGTLACASCHYAPLAFQDGRARARGRYGEERPTNTPALWNLAWAPRLFRDGRALSLEAQAREPIEHAAELATPMEALVARLAADPETARRFAAAFPEDPRVTAENAVKALASYQRAIVSPRTRFDAWIEGDEGALTPPERDGFARFVGAAGCVACHAGWRFTDDEVRDAGTGAAVKTPSLRELAWTGPYLRDGSAATLDAAIRRHAPPGGAAAWEDGLVEALAAFLAGLSSETPPRPAPLPPAAP